jgi:glucokinase
LPHLTPDNVTTLQRGSPDAQAPRAALGAGSGLGTVIALPTDDIWCVIPSEGGHADLAPGDTGELALLTALWECYGHASWERLLSGPGLEILYRFQRGLPADAPTGLSAPQISRAALEGRDADAVAALRTFCRLYGAQAGNLALTVLPRGGLYLAGGIAPQVLKPPFDEAFLDRFLAKGRLRPALERIPVHCITSSRTGLLGAAHYARIAANR